MTFRSKLNLGLLGSVASAALLFGACGGDDDGGGGGSDEDFVAAICAAGVEFADAFASIDVDPDDTKAAAEALAEPFEDFANAIDDADPPSDLKDWHGEMVKALNTIVKELKTGDEEAILAAFDVEFPEPPASASDRFEEIAAKNPDCAESDFAFGG